jgi:hypothetical protein
VIGKANNVAFPQHALDNVFGLLTGLLVFNSEHVLNRPAGCFLKIPSRQHLRNWIKIGNPAGCVGCQNCIADASEGCLESFPMSTQFVLREAQCLGGSNQLCDVICNKTVSKKPGQNCCSKGSDSEGRHVPKHIPVCTHNDSSFGNSDYKIEVWRESILEAQLFSCPIEAAALSGSRYKRTPL